VILIKHEPAFREIADRTSRRLRYPDILACRVRNSRFHWEIRAAVSSVDQDANPRFTVIACENLVAVVSGCVV